MSFVSYNGVSIPYALTKVHQIGPVMDPSGSDELYLKFRLEAEGVIAYEFKGDINPGRGTSSDEYFLKYIRHLLCQPRKPLYYDTELGQGGQGASDLPGPNALINIPTGRDDAGGPFPDPVAIDVQYTTGRVIVVKFAVETYVRECDPNTRTRVTTPLSIRWEEGLEFTDQFQAILTRRGTAILSSLGAINPDTLRRYWVTPDIPRGFARRTARYQMSRDGLRCDFEFVDEQLRFAPPFPATDVELVQNEETGPTGVGYREGYVTVRVTGNTQADPVALQTIASQVASLRLRAAFPERSGTGLIIGATKFQTVETRSSVSVVLSRTYRVRMRTGLIAGPIEVGMSPDPTGPDRYIPVNFGWVGYGTTRRTGYATWASPTPSAPTGVIGTTPDGFGMARAVGFYAALLRDPCGEAMEVTPDAGETIPRPLSPYSTGAGLPGIGETLVTTVSVPVGGGTTRSADWSSGFLNPGRTAGVFSTPAGTGAGSSTELQTEATAPPTRPATVTAALAAYSGPGVSNPRGVTNPRVSGDLAPGIYSLWQCYNEFDRDQGNVVVPTCNPEAALVQIKHSADVLIFRKKWTASKVGSPPALPAEDQGDNLVLVRKYVGLPCIDLSENTTEPVYRAEGVYEYVALNPSAARVVADSPPFLAPTWAAKVYDWADESAPKQLSDDGKTAPYFSTTVQPPAGVYDYPANQYVSSLGTGNTTTNTLSGTPPQPGGSVASGGVVKGGTSTGAGTIFSIGVGVPGAAGGRSAPNPGTPLFGGASTSSAAPFAASGGAAVVPAPPPQPEPDGGN